MFSISNTVLHHFSISIEVSRAILLCSRCLLSWGMALWRATMWSPKISISVSDWLVDVCWIWMDCSTFEDFLCKLPGPLAIDAQDDSARERFELLAVEGISLTTVKLYLVGLVSSIETCSLALVDLSRCKSWLTHWVGRFGWPQPDGLLGVQDWHSHTRTSATIKYCVVSIFFTSIVVVVILLSLSIFRGRIFGRFP